MFDSDGDLVIDPYEFESLWGYLTKWRGIFSQIDKDNSHTISRSELKRAFQILGYKFSDSFLQMVLNKFGNQTGNLQTLNFDDFVRLNCIINNLTVKFAQRDGQRSGHVLMGYEEFMHMVFESIM